MRLCEIFYFQTVTSSFNRAYRKSIMRWLWSAPTEDSPPLDLHLLFWKLEFFFFCLFCFFSIISLACLGSQSPLQFLGIVGSSLGSVKLRTDFCFPFIISSYRKDGWWSISSRIQNRTQISHISLVNISLALGIGQNIKVNTVLKVL